MKLKNSYILLIAMALFLLISVGSVCAADTGTSDGGILANESSGGTPSEDAAATIDTTVESEDVQVYEKDPVEIPVAVKDNESNTLNVAKENFTVTEGNKTINFNYNNSKIDITDKLNIGNHSLNINYLGNDVYKNSTKNIILSIFGDKTLTAPSLVASDGVTVEIPVIVSDGIREYTINENNVTLNLTYVDLNGNSSYMAIDSFTIENNAIRFLLNDLKFVSASVLINYTESGKTSKVDLKLATIVNAENIRVNEADDKNISVSVLFGETPLNISAKDLKVLENDKDVAFTYNNSIITINSLSKGNHTLTIKYLGNETYAESYKNVTASVVGNITINAKTPATVNSTKIAEVIISNITNGVDLFNYTLDDLTLTASYKVENDTVTVNVIPTKLENGTIYLKFENLNFTTATLTITYAGTVSTNVTINRIYNAKIEVLVSSNEFKNGAYKFKVIDVDDSSVSLKGKSISLYTTGNIRAGFSATLDENNTASFYTKNLYEFEQDGSITMKEFEVGVHPVEMSTSGDLKASTTKVNLTVTKANINIKISDFKEEYGTKKNVTITVTSKKDGSPVSGIVLHLYMPQTSGKNYYFVTDTNGQSKISVTNLVGGTYDVTVSNNDTKNINNAKTTGEIVITPKAAKINTNSVTRYYNTGVTSYIKITDKKTGKVLANTIVLVQLYTGSKYKAYLFQSNKKGMIQFSASLAVGKHKMVVQTADSRYSAAKVTKYITVKKVAAKLKAPKVTSYYRGGKYLTISLTTKKTNKPIYDAKVIIKVYVSKTKFYRYTGNTGANGKIKLALNQYQPGSYKVVVARGDTKNYTAKAITTKIVIKKAPITLTPKKLTAKQGTKAYFKVTVKNTKTKKVVPGVKVKMKVYTGKTYKLYTVKTNSKGIANLNVKDLSVGTHKVISYRGSVYCTGGKAKTSSIKITSK